MQYERFEVQRLPALSVIERMAFASVSACPAEAASTSAFLLKPNFRIRLVSASLFAISTGELNDFTASVQVFGDFNKLYGWPSFNFTRNGSSLVGRPLLLA